MIERKTGEIRKEGGLCEIKQEFIWCVLRKWRTGLEIGFIKVENRHNTVRMNARTTVEQSTRSTD